VAVKQRWLFLAVSVVVVASVVALASGAVGPAGSGLYRLVGVFAQVVSLVKSSYEEEIPLDRLEMGAMNGLVESVDPGGLYVPDEMIADYAKVRARALPAFGLVLGRRSSYPFVVQVIPGSPAAQAGIVAGELIERVGKEPVRARPLWRPLTLLDAAERGPGEVTLDVIDRQLAGKRPVTLKVAPFAQPALSIEGHDGVPVVRVAFVDPGSAAKLSAALRGNAATASLVVDLRGVALGNAEGALRIAAELAGGDVQIRLGQKDGKGETLKATGAARPWKLFVCVDATTFGPAELLALALKGRGATLVGSDSYGDTGQRRAIRGAGGEIWLAFAWGVSTDGKPLLGAGLKPDDRVRPRREADAVLNRALELAGGRAVKQAA
jgi:carboxyl-terminal processing protease